MWKIKDIEINSHVVLGPMAGITSLAYREFMKPFGVGLSYSEMVSDCGIDYGNQKTLDYLKTSSIDRPIGIQLFGSSIESTVKAIKIIEESGYDFDILDINLGCPVPKVTKAGSGSSWLLREEELFDYMSAIVKASKHPVTAKIRLGWDENHINFKNVIALLEKAGVSAISIHARTAKQGYSGIADYNILKDIAKDMKVPLIISGDIFSLDDAIKAKEITGATAVMVARGGVGNPNLITQINHYFERGERLPDVSLSQSVEFMIQYVEMLIKEKGEKLGILVARGIAPKFLNRYSKTKQIRVKLSQSMSTYDDFINIIKEVKI